MLRIAYAVCLLTVAALSSGCAMCCSPYDDCYNAFGGVTPRCDQCCGRVGSVFDSAGCEEEVAPAEYMEEQSPQPSPQPAPPAQTQPHAQRPQRSVKK